MLNGGANYRLSTRGKLMHMKKHNVDEWNTSLVLKPQQIQFRMFLSNSTDFLNFGMFSEIICQSKGNTLNRKFLMFMTALLHYIWKAYITYMYTKLSYLDFYLLNTEMQPNFTTVNTIGPVFMRAELGGIPAACLYMTNSTTPGH